MTLYVHTFPVNVWLSLTAVFGALEILSGYRWPATSSARSPKKKTKTEFDHTTIAGARFARVVWLAILLSLTQFGAVSTGAAQDTISEDFHSVVPLGSESIVLLPARKPLFLLASAVSPEFEGWRAQGMGRDRHVLARDGTPVAHYPQRIRFRVTASAHVTGFADDAYSMQFQGDLDRFLLDLSFRLQIFEGLEATVLQPILVQIVGVPSDIPYDERIYSVEFDVGRIPLSRRMVLDVRDPAGQRLCKFHLEFE
jgi:hypothetical protein